MTALSDKAKAFRNSIEGLAREHAARTSSLEQSWRDSAKEGQQSAKEASEKAQKLVQRVRERAAHLRSLDTKRGVEEISVNEEPETEDPDPEVERFSQQLYAQQKRAEETAATTAQAAQPAQPERSAVPRPPEPEQSSGWNVQAGRFGRRNESAPPPPAAPKPPSAPGPAPRRQQPDCDDDDDFENQSWLR